MSKRTVNKTGWGMSRWTDDIIVSSIRDTRDLCIYDYARANPDEPLDKLWEMGFECVEVKIISVDP